MNGFVLFYRELWEWEHWDDAFMVKLLVHVNLLATHQPYNVGGVELERGEFVASYQQIANKMGCSPRKARTGMEKLIRCGEITKKIGTPNGTPNGTPPNVWKVTKYEKFQMFTNVNGTPNGTSTGTHYNNSIYNNPLKEKNPLKGEKKENSPKMGISVDGFCQSLLAELEHGVPGWGDGLCRMTGLDHNRIVIEKMIGQFQAAQTAANHPGWPNRTRAQKHFREFVNNEHVRRNFSKYYSQF